MTATTCDQSVDCMPSSIASAVAVVTLHTMPSNFLARRRRTILSILLVLAACIDSTTAHARAVSASAVAHAPNQYRLPVYSPSAILLHPPGRLSSAPCLPPQIAEDKVALEVAKAKEDAELKAVEALPEKNRRQVRRRRPPALRRRLQRHQLCARC